MVVGGGGSGSNPFDVNLRAILAFLDISKGYAGIATFCGYMNIPPLMTELTFNDTITTTMYSSYVEVAGKHMQNSATDLRKQILDEYTKDEVCDIAVSCHGTWQRCGYASTM